MYKRYYTPFDEKPVVRDFEPETPSPRGYGGERRDAPLYDDTKADCPPAKSGLFANFSTEDVILIGLLILLIMEDGEDRDLPLLLAVGFLLIMGYIDGGE